MSEVRCGWEHFAHGSDIGVRGFGPSMEAAFEQAALALTARRPEVRGQKVEIGSRKSEMSNSLFGVFCVEQ